MELNVKKQRKTKAHTYCKQRELKKLYKTIEELESELAFHRRYKEGYSSAVDTITSHLDKKIIPLETQIREYKYRLAQSENRRAELEIKMRKNGIKC